MDTWSSTASRRAELEAVYPPFAGSFLGPQAKLQGLKGWDYRGEHFETKPKHTERELYWAQQNAGIQEGLLDPQDAMFAAPVQALRGVNNWNLDLTSPRLQAAEQKEYQQQKVARYNAGEEVKEWDPTTWHNVVGARAGAAHMQGLSMSLSKQPQEAWSLDDTSSRLKDAEKKKYYQLRRERYDRGESQQLPYPSDETWIMPSARAARLSGLYQQPFANGWQADDTSDRLARAEKKAYMKNEAQRFSRGESDGPSPWNGDWQTV